MMQVERRNLFAHIAVSCQKTRIFQPGTFRLTKEGLQLSHTPHHTRYQRDRNLKKKEKSLPQNPKKFCGKLLKDFRMKNQSFADKKTQASACVFFVVF